MHRNKQGCRATVASAFSVAISCIFWIVFILEHVKIIFTTVYNVDSLDWKDYGVNDILTRVVESDKLNNGAIILMHNGAKYTADALEAVITGLQDKGYEIVPISQLIYKDKYHMKADGTQVSGE